MLDAHVRGLPVVNVRLKFPLLWIEDILEILASTCYFSNLNVMSGYRQIPIHPENSGRTAFTMKFTLFQPMVIPFGLTHAPPHSRDYE